MTNEDEKRSVQQRVQDALSDVFQAEDEYITKWIVVCEVLDLDGSRALWAVSAEECESWDILGMLAWGTQHEQGGRILRMISEAAQESEEEEE